MGVVGDSLLRESRRFQLSSSNIPTEPHWVIITFSSVYIPGDERSRTNPGHGYPAETVNYTVYTGYLDQTEWEKEIERLALAGAKFLALDKVDPKRVRLEHKVVLG